MSESHSLRLEINATAAKRGAQEFEGAINKIDRAVKRLESSTTQSFSAINRSVGRVNFSALSRAMSSLNNVRIDPSLARNINSLSRALQSIGTIPRGAINGLNLISNAIRNLRAPSNTASIVTSLTSITNAANATYTALNRLGQLNVNIRQPRQTGGGRINPVTGRAQGGVQAGYGFGPGRSSQASLRGFENVSNLSYQAGSAVRTAVGGLTAGAVLGQITSITRETERFRVALESVGATAQQARQIQDSLGEASVRLGLDFRSVQEQSRGFISGAIASGVGVQEAATMFDNLTVSMRASGLGMQQTEGALRAMTQMFGKGRITAEELRQQMAEHWSSFGPLLARYLYPQISDAQERMRRLTEDISKRSLNPRVLIDFARTLREQTQGLVREQSQTLDAAVLRVGSAWQLLMKELGEGEAGKALRDTFNRFAEILRDPVFRQFAQDVGVGLANVLRTLGEGAVWASQNLDKVKIALTAVMAIASGNLVIGIARAVGSLATPFIAVARAIGVVRGGTAAATPAVALLAAAFTAVKAAAISLFSVVAAHPFVAIGLAIAGIIAYFVNWRRLMSGLSDVWDNFAESARRAWNDIKDFASITWGQVNSFFIAPLKDFATWVGGGFVSVWNSVRDAIKEAFDPNSTSPFAQALRGLIDQAGTLLTTLGRGIAAATQGPNQVASPGQNGILSRTFNGTGNGATPIPGYGTVEGPTPRQSAQFQRFFDNGQRLGFGQSGANPFSASMPQGPTHRSAEQASERTAEAMRWEARQSGSTTTRLSERDMWGPGTGGGGRNRRESVENFFSRLDPSFRVMEEYQDGLARIQQARQMGIGTAQQHAHWEGLLRDQFLQQVGATDSVVRAQRQYERSLATIAGAEQAGFLSTQQAADARERLNAATEEARNPIGFMISQMQTETDLLNQRNGVMEDELQLLRIRNQLRQQGVLVGDTEADQIRTSIANQRRANQAYKDSQEGIASWANSFRDFGTELAKFEEKFLNQFADALTEFIMTGKAGWRDLANSIVSDINNLIIKQGIRELLTYLGLINGNTSDGFQNQGSGILGGLFGGNSTNRGGGQSGGGGIFSELLGRTGWWNSLGSSGGISGVGGVDAGAWASLGSGMYGPVISESATSAMGSSGGIFSSIIGGISSLFAKEGYMPGSNKNISAMMPATAFVGAPRFAEGGITNGGIPAVLHDNEAVIPLSRGRKVPVEGGGSKVTNMFNIQTPDADSFRKSAPQILKTYNRKMNRISQGGG